MTRDELIAHFQQHPRVAEITHSVGVVDETIQLSGLSGSGASMVLHSAISQLGGSHLIILNDREEAAYFHSDLKNLFSEKRLKFLPSSYRSPFRTEKINDADVLQRSETLDAIAHRREAVMVTYPQAISEKVVARKELKKKTLDISVGSELSIDFVNELLFEYDFFRVDFVAGPGDFAIRGGIVDVFSFANDTPYRIEFFGDEVASIRTFDPSDQRSLKDFGKISIVPDLRQAELIEERVSLLDFILPSTKVWVKNLELLEKNVEQTFELAKEQSELKKENINVLDYYQSSDVLKSQLKRHALLEFGNVQSRTGTYSIDFNQSPQPEFHKNFELLSDTFTDNTKKDIQNLIAASVSNQIERLHTIFEDMEKKKEFTPLLLDLHEGYVDRDVKIACYTDHQIFERFHRFHLKEGFKKSQQQITLKDLARLEKGDYVTHIDHGIGRFEGLIKIENNGKEQEVIKLVYRDNDVLFVSIHSLHRIARYTGREGTLPKVNKLGSSAWATLKNKTKKRIKKVAYDLIKLYAERKASRGFAFSPDSYLQFELEASFIYEDTPDQAEATKMVKEDMEAEAPMDRLICGDVGFGKTEIAIRAAFKAAENGKQTAILVPTTILALQHYNSLSKRFADFPVTLDYLNRFRSAKEIREVLRKLEAGEIDIIIGTHKLVGKEVKFKDLGLLVIDEEQKFGVSVKDKLKTIKKNVDTLTLTATPIPRTLQFSMMGARDLSVINTPPPNRQPVQTEIHSFNEEIFRESIQYEISRGGQVFVVNNRVQNLEEVAELVRRSARGVRVITAHGQLEGRELENRMMQFIRGEQDVLVATTIIESGIDISNANTIIINNAHQFGLSDLHQMRGRVGRSNRKAFCYLIAPPFSTLTTEARKRLTAISQFSDLGSGIHIAMRDLDIRGAGDLLGAEQSGFINELGFEMYQKVLDEAITELKSNEFKEHFEQDESFVKETLFESDLQLLLPDQYVNKVSERIELYKRLSECNTENELLEFQEELVDRFGAVPEEGENLIQSVRLKWHAAELGLEKLLLKGGKMVGSFVANPESDFYNSSLFYDILDQIKNPSAGIRLKESKNRLSMVFDHTPDLDTALSKLDYLLQNVGLVQTNER
ncbi:MAG TPA: transcription-repair coupling factor [Flavobacteriales bacterium]|jgi:transcription-repair coupling factor (superfamily II helicase)|nr:transcription-repair coupling factor [Flavobacteriales bacterium]